MFPHRTMSRRPTDRRPEPSQPQSPRPLTAQSTSAQPQRNTHPNPPQTFRPFPPSNTNSSTLPDLASLSLTDPARLEPHLGLASDEVIFTRAKQFFGSTAILSQFLDSFRNPSPPSRKTAFDAVFLSKNNYGQKFLDLVISNTPSPTELRTFFAKISFVMRSKNLLSATEFLSVQLPDPHTILTSNQSTESTSANLSYKKDPIFLQNMNLSTEEAADAHSAFMDAVKGV